MSGIDNPIKKFERVPRSVFDAACHEYYEKQRLKREKEEIEKRALMLKSANAKKPNHDAFVNRELQNIMEKLEYDFNVHKEKLLATEFPHGTFQFRYRVNGNFGADARQIVADKAKTLITELVSVRGYCFDDDGDLFISIDLVVPGEGAPVTDAQQTQ